jgi:hypothetical protein
LATVASHDRDAGWIEGAPGPTFEMQYLIGLRDLCVRELVSVGHIGAK